MSLISKSEMNLAQVLLSGSERFPHAMAIHHGAHHLTYEQVFQDSERIAARLFHLGIRPGQLVATDIQRPISQWLVLLALLRIGAVSVSLTDRFEAEVSVLPDLEAVICGPEEERVYGAGLRKIHIGTDWLRSAPPAATPLPSVADAARTMGRICFTSGTSGRPKAILLDAALLHARLSGTAMRTRIHARSVLWCGLGADTAYGFTATIAAWLEGGSVIFSGGGQGSWQYLSDQHVNLIVASPAALGSVLRDAQAGSLPKMQGAVIVAGGRLTVAQRDAVQDRLCTEVFVAYGSSEAGGVTLGNAKDLDLHPGHVGTVFADAEARIVGANGEALAHGASGRLQVRTSSLAPGYVNDPVASAEHFEGGWFQSGDVAMLSAGRTITLLGRPADILNVGGVKVSADEIDAAARSHDEVDDACAIVVSLGGTAQQLAIVVAGGLRDGSKLAAHIRSKLPRTPRFHLVSATSIPRGSMGKVNRGELADQVETVLATPPPDDAPAHFKLLGTY